MDFGLSESTEKILKDFFEKFSEIEKVKIYGSRAIGTYRKSSDIDFVIYSTSNISSKLLSELDELPLPYMYDVTDYKSIENVDLKDHIDNYAKIFYESK